MKKIIHLKTDFLSTEIWLGISTLILGISIVFVFSVGHINNKLIVLICLLPILLITLPNFKIIYSINIILIFLRLYYYDFAFAVLFTSILSISYIISYKEIKFQDFKNPITLPFLFYLLMCVPSLLFTEVLGDSLLEMIHLFGFIIILLITIGSINSKREIKNYLLVFLTATTINAVAVIIDGLSTGQRTFGLSDVMYVDFVGIGVVITLIFTIMLKSKGRFISFLLLIVLSLGSLFTQTRNAWISIIVASFFLIIYLLKKSEFFEISKKSFITAVVCGMLLIGVGISLLGIVDPAVFQRTEEFQESNKEILNEKGEASSSVIMRLFIWHTAYNAFIKNPIAGVGIYAFPYTSKKYYTIPDFLYYKYVVGRTPHITYLAVITETGIIGLTGFLVFIFMMLKISLSTINMARTKNEKILALTLAWPIVYIVISMFMTDAWLWQRGIIAWGIFLGMILALRKIITLQITTSENQPNKILP